MEQKRKQTILIADDSEINRSILVDILGDEYDILEAEDGVQAVAAIRKHLAEIDLVLLDIVMPEMDGFEVLTVMNQQNWIEDLPVIMISAESAPAHMERAYNLGVTDFISRPFNALVVHRRVVNTTLLYAKQKKLVNLVAEQIYEKEQQNGLMIDILSHIVEFRNGESGQHVLHIRTLTELFLQHLILKTDRYQITRADISLISTASALHDIGKIAIPSEVLNKPGRLTDEEFKIMKTHSAVGADMMDSVPVHQGERLVAVARSICRWHHERWDGRGYPDGLKGDEIPIEAQIVALADVYDALTSPRCYKPAFTHAKAVEMILGGQCGTFNPLILECLTETADRLPEMLRSAQTQASHMELRSVAEEMHRHEELSASERTLQLLEHERMKYNFFAAMTQELQFEYTDSPPMLILSAWGAEKLGLGETVMDPLHNERALAIFSGADMHRLSQALRAAPRENPVVTYVCKIRLGGAERWHRIIARTTWSSDEPPKYTGFIGKAVDIHDSHEKLATLEQEASHDALTGLLNHAYAQKRILAQIEAGPSSHYALAILDLDHFKSANDNFGHSFGDQVLKHMAERLHFSIRGGDTAARVGGDEFLIFLEYTSDLEPVIDRIYQAISGGKFDDFTISVSMGVATTEMVGYSYDTLFHAADQALYTVKRGGRGRCCFYEQSMADTLSAISPIDGGEDPEGNTTNEKETEQ